MILSLVYPEKSRIPYKINKFPDGQQDIVIGECTKKKVIIESRLRNWLDLELIVASVAALRRLRVETIGLSLPYLLGARSDRAFVEGGNSYLVDVLAPVINSLELDAIIVFDVHSDVAPACIKNLTLMDNLILVKFALENIEEDLKDLVVVSPDAGALKKIYNVMFNVGLSNLVVASKHRDIPTGKITHTEVPLSLIHYKKDFLIIDDICDGGRTFIEIAKKIKAEYPSAKIYLVVSHGIFSAGFEELSIYFERIFTTNSYSDINHPLVKQFNVWTNT